MTGTINPNFNKKKKDMSVQRVETGTGSGEREGREEDKGGEGVEIGQHSRTQG